MMWGTVEQMRDHYQNTPGLSGRAPVDVLDCLNEIDRLTAEAAGLRAPRDAGNDPFMAEMADVCNENAALRALLREAYDWSTRYRTQALTADLVTRLGLAVDQDAPPTDDPWTLRDALLPMSLDASCIECENKRQPDGGKCPRCWGMTRTEQAASIEETRRLLSLAFTERKTA